MSTGLAAGITWIQATLRTLPGLRAPILPPQSIVEYPTAIVYEGSGTWTTEAADQYKYLGTLLIDMPIPAVDFETGLRSLRPFIEALPKIILADTSLGHAVSTFGPLQFSGLINLIAEAPGQPTLYGYRWTLQNIKLRSP